MPYVGGGDRKMPPVDSWPKLYNYFLLKDFGAGKIIAILIKKSKHFAEHHYSSLNTIFNCMHVHMIYLFF
jgi:hypothetical protein